MGKQSKSNINYKKNHKKKKSKGKNGLQNIYPEGIVSGIFIIKMHHSLEEQLVSKKLNYNKDKIYAITLKVLSLIYNIDLDLNDTLRKIMNSVQYNTLEIAALGAIESHK